MAPISRPVRLADFEYEFRMLFIQMFILRVTTYRVGICRSFYDFKVDEVQSDLSLVGGKITHYPFVSKNKEWEG